MAQKLIALFLTILCLDLSWSSNHDDSYSMYNHQGRRNEIKTVGARTNSAFKKWQKMDFYSMVF